MFDLKSWNRWGRVGEIGQNNGLELCSDVNAAIKLFEKKFKDKTRNDWNDRKNFKPSPGKYTLIEMDGGGDEEDDDDNGAVTTQVSFRPKVLLKFFCIYRNLNS